MIKTLRMSAAGAAIAFAALATAATAAETETATAEAEIVLAFTLTKDTDLDFGAIVNGAGGGTAVIATDGSVTCGGALVCHGATTAASFSVEGGTVGKRVYVDLPDTSGGPLLMVHSNAAALIAGGTSVAATQIQLGSFTSTTASDAIGRYVTIADDGTGVGEAGFAVGGTATLDGSEVEGTYSTTFDVTVDYD